MGIENMRRWPIYLIFSVCILLAFQLFNSWGIENDLTYRIGELSSQLEDCSKQHSGCMEETLVLEEQKQGQAKKVLDLDKIKDALSEDIKELRKQNHKVELKLNQTLVNLEFCRAEVQSLNTLRLTGNATLQTLRLEKDTLMTQLNERKKKIGTLESEIERLKAELKLALSSKSFAPSAAPKVTPPSVAAPPKMSPQVLSNLPVNEPVVEPAVEDNAKEELEENINNNNEVNNDNNDVGNDDKELNDNEFDPQMQ